MKASWSCWLGRTASYVSYVEASFVEQEVVQQYIYDAKDVVVSRSIHGFALLVPDDYDPDETRNQKDFRNIEIT